MRKETVRKLGIDGIRRVRLKLASHEGWEAGRLKATTGKVFTAVTVDESNKLYCFSLMIFGM